LENSAGVKNNWVKLDLKKHNLEHFKGKHLTDLTDEEIEHLMDAAASDDIALSLGAHWSEVNVRWVLDEAKCVNCGRCCHPNPNRPGYAGIEVFVKELDTISSASHISKRKLLKITSKGEDAPTQTDPTRWLPLPCLFYDQVKHRCEIHQSKPVVCRLYPFSMSGDILAVHVDCMYGKDVFRNMIKELKQKTKDPLFIEIMPNPHKTEFSDFGK
jgi:Fe-S-cluster containining protein